MLEHCRGQFSAVAGRKEGFDKLSESAGGQGVDSALTLSVVKITASRVAGKSARADWCGGLFFDRRHHAQPYKVFHMLFRRGGAHDAAVIDGAAPGGRLHPFFQGRFRIPFGLPEDFGKLPEACGLQQLTGFGAVFHEFP